jgi:hypothetical protein
LWTGMKSGLDSFIRFRGSSEPSPKSITNFESQLL